MIPLVTRSHYSLMWGTASVNQLCHAAARLGYTRLALTDTDSLCGLWPFIQACRLHNLRPLVGAEVTDPKTGKRAVCLVENGEGYRNLCRLLTRRHGVSWEPMRKDEPFSLEQEVIRHAAGLVVLTTEAAHLEVWREAGVAVAAAQSRQPGGAGELARHAARRLEIPLVAVPDSYFLSPRDHEVHRVLRAIAGNCSLSRLTPKEMAPEGAWLAAPDEYRRRFTALPEAVDATAALAERCAFTGPEPTLVLPPWDDARGRTAAVLLREAAFAGARRRYGDDLSEPAVERLEYELRRIEEKHFSAYFLVVQQIVRRSPRICGRGSAAASLVAYCLGITNVCPLKHKLYFERFLNPARSDPPDIDVDFAWDERDAVLESVFAQYGDRAAMVSSHVLFQPRMAIREVAKVYGLTGREINQVVKRMPWLWPEGEEHTANLQARLKALPEMRSLDFPEPWPVILGLAQRLLGAPRTLSVHPGGMVITPRPVDQYAPIQRATKGVPILQWDKEGAEDGGLVKIDLLGNRSLAVIRDAVNNVHENGVPFDEARWEPEDDEATQRAVAEGRTMGCFYIESPAMRQLLRRAGKGDFEHLVIHSSIIRPAANAFIREYLRRLKGGGWEPIHPLLADVLDETFGIMVYQEDVSRVAVALAGFSHSEADGLRKILSKRDRELRLRHTRERFFEGARARGVAREKIEAVWSMIMSFDGYSFCKPHSASYARVSFQAAYLKVHHPAEFMAAVISNQGGFYGTFAYVSEARRMGLTILPPHVNHSELRWRGRKLCLRVGLQAIKGLSVAAQQRILAARGARAFSDLGDLLRRARPDEEEARALVHGGTCDELSAGAGAARGALVWELARWRQVKRRGRGREGRMRGESGELFAEPSVPPPALPSGGERDRLRRQFDVLGFLCDRHPLTLFRRPQDDPRAITARQLDQRVGQRVRFWGWPIAGKTVPTKRGEPMKFLTFEDQTGMVETTFFPRAYSRYCSMLQRGRPLLLEGKVEQDFGVATLTVDRVTAVRG